MVHHIGDGLGHRPHVSEVGLAIHAGGGAHSDEGELGIRQRLGVVGGEGETTAPNVALDELLQSRLVDGHDALLEFLDFLFVNVQTDHLVAQVGEACACYQTHVSRSDNTDTAHPLASSLRDCKRIASRRCLA